MFYIMFKEDEPMDHTLGAQIRQARKIHGMSQVELARRIGISKTAMNDIESGGTRDPRFSVVQRISKALGVSLDLFQPEEALHA